MIKTLEPLILASGSEVRAHLLSQMGIDFKIIEPLINEEDFKADLAHLLPVEQALELARIKGESVSRVYPESYVISADQVCALDDEKCIFDKPKTLEKARHHLQMLRGKEHSQNSGICLSYGGRIIWQHTQTAKITLRHLSDDEIDAYLTLDEPLMACGGYRLESYGKHLFSGFEGTEDNIMGLPLVALLSELHQRQLIQLAK